MDKNHPEFDEWFNCGIAIPEEWKDVIIQSANYCIFPHHLFVTIIVDGKEKSVEMRNFGNMAMECVEIAIAKGVTIRELQALRKPYRK